MSEITLTRQVPRFDYGFGSLKRLASIINSLRNDEQPSAAVFVDDFFRDGAIDELAGLPESDMLAFVSAAKEPTTDQVDELSDAVKSKFPSGPFAVVGVGGGATLDIAKAVANLQTNPGKAADYQGWDLLKHRSPFKIGVPTLSGTGAEASRTCVMLNRAKNLKLGMNSEFTLYDHLVLDPSLSRTVERSQYFFTGMDTYIHCIESLSGSYRNAFADAMSEKSLELARDVFSSEDMMADEERSRMMLASYFGGSAIGNSFVGVVHPLSAALSVVYGTPHCKSNCIVMDVMEDYYPEETREFREMRERQGISIEKGICRGATDEEFERLHKSSVIHEKPLENALGADFLKELTPERTRDLFSRM